MKSLKLLLIVVVITMLSTSKLIGQWATATSSDIAMSANVNSRSTGNDYLVFGSDQIEVSVWDEGGNAAGFGYRINSGSQTIVTLSTTYAFDPDVCMVVDNNGDLFALAAYYDAYNNDYLLDVLEYNSTSHTFALSGSSPYYLNSSVAFGDALNIDGDDDGNFGVIWDDSNKSLISIVGYINSGTVNIGTLCTATGSQSGTGTFPDICLYGDGTNLATYTYLINGDIYVDSDDISSLYSGSSSSTNEFYDNSAAYEYKWPRISCPPTSVGSSTDWTVVFMDTDNSTYYICGVTDNSGTTGAVTIYNDGSTGNSPDNTTGVPNTYPVVSYDDNSTYGIYVGWMINNPGSVGLSITGTLPIVVQCNQSGQIISNADYLEVSNSPSNGDFDIALSLSGKNGPDCLFMTWEKDGNTDVYTKRINNISSAANLRLSNQIDSSIPINSSIVSQIQIIDMQGNIIFYSDDSKYSINYTYEKLKNLPAGIYIMKSLNSDGSFTCSKISIIN